MSTYRNQVSITEVCSAGTQTCNLDYDQLPAAVKSAVEAALRDPKGSLGVDIYAQGLQAMNEESHARCVIAKGEIVRNLGTVTLYHKND